MKPTPALALLIKGKIIPEWIISPKNKNWYILKKGEKFEEVVIISKKDYLKLIK